MGFCHNCNQEVSSKFCPNCGKEAVELVKSTKDSNTPALIDELYALRSGLSRISQENDKVKDIEKSLNDQKKLNLNIICLAGMEDGDLKYFQSLRRSIREKYELPNKDNLNNKKHLTDLCGRNTKEANKWKKNLFIALTITVISIVVLVIGSVIPTLGEGFFAGIGAVGLIAAGICSIVFSKRLAEYSNYVKSNKNKIAEINNTIKSQEQLQAEILKDPQYIEFDKKYREAEEEYKKAKNFDYSPLENALSEQKNASMEFYKDFYPTYLARFEKVLDPRDWCNLDLVIFILETGRADNLRDALIQVDGYRHTEAIVKAVNSASQAICRTITSEADRLQRAIATHVDTINSNLVAISKGQKALSDSLGGINASINKQINATELQNALLEKANTSSDRLATDLEEIRNYFIK